MLNAAHYRRDDDNNKASINMSTLHIDTEFFTFCNVTVTC